MTDLFSTPIRAVHIKGEIYAYQYMNGTITIDGQKYLMYSMSEAIKKYKQSVKNA